MPLGSLTELNYEYRSICFMPVAQSASGASAPAPDP